MNTYKNCYNDSGMSTVVGIILITALIVVTSAAIIAIVGADNLQEPVIANIEIESYNVSDQVVVLVHNGGDSFDVSHISIVINVNGDTIPKNLLELPTFGASGFNGIGGVLSTWSDDNYWNPGDHGSFKIGSSTNKNINPGDTISIVIFHRISGSIISSPTLCI